MSHTDHGAPDQINGLSDELGIVDVHAHVMIPSYQDLLVKAGYQIPGYRPAASTPEQRPPSPSAFPATDSDEAILGRLSLMDDAGVARQLLSTVFAPYLKVESEAVAAARHVNEVHARIIRRHPDRFSAFTALPLPHIGAALEEMRRGMDDLGMIGVGLHCFCLDQSTADDHFLPLYEEMNKRHAVVFFHPSINGLCSQFVTEWGLTSSAGAVFEDTAIALHLIVKKIPSRFPNIKFIVPHLGGALPMLLDRLDNQLPLSVPDLPEKPSVTAKRFWYDSVGHGSKAACCCAIEAFGGERILPGSDYPVLLPFEGYSPTFDYIRRMGLEDSLVRKILYDNVLDVFGDRLRAL
jgi:6-methylsalicylate decarboxylase